MAISLIAHATLLVAWLSTRAPPLFVEPPVMQVELMRPPARREPPKPTAVSRPNAPATAAAPQIQPVLPPVLSQPPGPSAPVPTGPRPVDPQQMTDGDILEQSGPRPDIAGLHREFALRPLSSKRLPPGPDDCKPATEHSNRIALPCHGWGAGALHGPPQLPDRPDIAAQAESKTIYRSYGYRQGYGAPGVANPDSFPGLNCTLRGRCKPPEPKDPSGYDPKRPER